MAPFRIALVVDQFPELSETFVSGEAAELRRAGHQVRVDAGRPATTTDPEAAPAVPVAYISDDPPLRRLRDTVWLVARHPVRSLRDLRDRRRWAPDEPPRRLRELAPAARRASRDGTQHLHAHFAAGAALDAMRIGSLLGLPYSLVTHGYDLFARPRNLREKHERAAFAVAVCDYSLAHLRQVLGDGSRADLHRIVVGVDGERFRRRMPHPGGRTVVAVGRLVEKKGFTHLVAAAAELRERGNPLDRVIIAGEGPLRPVLERQIADLGLCETVELVGARRPAEVRELLERADVLAAPCVVAADGDRDTMPVAVKEALAMEVPVIASDAVGLPELVRPGWGRLCRPGDAAALAGALDEILALDVGERARLGAAGREHVLSACSLSAGTAQLAALIERASGSV